MTELFSPTQMNDSAISKATKMNIFVTVGNTQYNSLIKIIDESLSPDEFDVIIQIAGGDYIPINHKYFRYTKSISQYFQDADIVIAHAGAGTVFELLEDNIKMVVIPNYERVDDHQLDLADYVDKNQFACVCYDLATIKNCIYLSAKTTYKQYVNEPFHGYKIIDDTFNITAPNVVANLPLNIFTSMEDAVNHVINESGDVIAGSAIAINPEKVIRSLDEPSIKDALMSATLRYADGIGVVKTLMRKSQTAVARIPGCELWEAIMEKAGKLQIPVYLVGASADTINATKEKLIRQYQVNICGIQDGYFDINNQDNVIAEIAKIQPKIVTVALGSPRQELFIQQCRALCPNTFFMGVGGTYDVYTNKVKRAPVFYRRLNLEWFYRLAHQPSRIFRQGNLVRYLFLEMFRKL